MTSAIKSFPKPTRLKLHGKDYENLVRQVFTRDGWQCRRCGARKNLTPHHLKKRSQLGGDELGNVITLCTQDHEDVEQHKLHIEVVDVVVTFSKGEDDDGTKAGR